MNLFCYTQGPFVRRNLALDRYLVEAISVKIRLARYMRSWSNDHSFETPWNLKLKFYRPFLTPRMTNSNFVQKHKFIIWGKGYETLSINQ